VKPRLYLETTIPSYLTAWPSRDVVILGHQETTREWWATCRERFELYVSALVVNEAAQGDAEAARLRLQALQDIPELAASPSAEELAAALLREGAVPAVARIDAAHIAIAAVHGMDFLVTWNCRHIANAEMEPRIRQVCARHGWPCPVICTPEQLLPPGKGDTP
jgi:predicted nucleic acid-binding protein